jgi:hypothetical protein
MTLLVVSLVLAACGSGSTTSTTTGTDATAASASNAASAQGTLSPVAKNILGIFKLEGTDLAVDSTQAATLLPLWQAYRSLLKSDTAAPAELEAIQTQIGEALAAKQQDAIAAMNLTPQDMFAMAEELGVTQAPSGTGTDSNSTRPNFSAGGQGGPGGSFTPPEGGFFQGGSFPGGAPGDSSFPPSDMAEGMDPAALATMQASRPAGSSQGSRFSLALLDPLIELLKERAGS